MYFSFNQLQNAASKSFTKNDYSPVTITAIQQKLDQWQLDINQLRQSDPQSADTEESAMLNTLANFQIELDTGIRKTLAKTQSTQTQPAAPESPASGIDSGEEPMSLNP